MNAKVVFSRIGIFLSCTILACIYLLFFSQTLSPLYTIETCDSSVFKLMGRVILHGKIPYVDMFDHKGPVLYCIQAFGQWLIPGRNGLFVLATIALTISITCWYYTARLFTNLVISFITIILTLITYNFYAEYGNLTEDWNILFISLSFYLIVSLVKSHHHWNYLIHGCFVGICLACSFLIRPNDAVSFIAAPIFGTLIRAIKDKKYRDSIMWLGGITIGFILVTAIFITWFAYHNALPDLWYGLIGFNSKYATGLMGLIKGGFKIAKLSYVPFLVTLLILCWQLKDKYMLFVLIPTIPAAYILQGNDAYLHYWIIWIPILFFLYWLFACIQKNRAFTILALCVFLSLPIFDNSNWLKVPIRMYNEVKRDIQYQDSAALLTNDLFTSIEPEDKDSIWSYNLTWHNKTVDAPNAFNVLLYNDIIPCNRVPLIFMANRDSTLLRYMDITKAKPKYILFSQQHVTPYSYGLRDSIYILENYHTINSCTKPELVLFERNKED